MTVPRIEIGTLAVDGFSTAIGIVTESANGLVRLQHPNGYSWKAYATNLRPPEEAEKRQFEAAQRTWSDGTGQARIARAYERIAMEQRISHHPLRNDNCDHDWVQWSGATRCRKCGATQQ